MPFGKLTSGLGFLFAIGCASKIQKKKKKTLILPYLTAWATLDPGGGALVNMRGIRQTPKLLENKDDSSLMSTKTNSPRKALYKNGNVTKKK